MDDSSRQSAMIIGTAVTSLITGYVLGVYAIRGYLISPELVEERRRATADPVESEESDVDEGDVPLDHAPNWANGRDADKRQGLSQSAAKSKPAAVDINTNEECKLVLVVRTDLGMTKGTASTIDMMGRGHF
jgi:peptidyl-tRNA hydrolase, PTH2 family